MSGCGHAWPPDLVGVVAPGPPDLVGVGTPSPPDLVGVGAPGPLDLVGVGAPGHLDLLVVQMVGFSVSGLPVCPRCWQTYSRYPQSQAGLAALGSVRSHLLSSSSVPALPSA